MFTLKFAANPPPSQLSCCCLISNNKHQRSVLSFYNWKVFFHIYYWYLIIFMFTAIFTWKICVEIFAICRRQGKSFKKEVKEHKRSSKLKDNSYSNLPIGCSSSNIYFQPLNLVSVFQFLLKSNFSWSTFCLSSQHNLPSKLNIWLKLNFLVQIF